MEFSYISSYKNDDFENGDFETREYDSDKKNKVLAYMKSFNPIAFTSAPLFDPFTCEKVKDANNGYSDDTFMWYESDIYYLEHYNLKISDKFIDMVCGKNIDKY